MPHSPRDVFEDPAKYWGFLTVKSDEDFEGQHFDRKEAGQPQDFQGPGSRTALGSLRDQIKECVSAFANSNVEGGLLVLGISSSGEIKGVDHLNENQLNAVVIKGLAMQILSLTKLNWASTDSLCGEPITTKYAGDIAYLTAAFMRQGKPFNLHPVLEQTPWFI